MKRGQFQKISIYVMIFLLIGVGLVSTSSSDMEYPKDLDNNTFTFYPTNDTFVTHSHPDETRGSEIHIKTKTESSYEKYAMIHFDISSIPSDSDIYSAKLKIYYYDYHPENSAGHTLNLYKIIEDWDEDTATWNNQPTHSGVVTDFVTIPPSPGVWLEWDVTSDVQDFIDGTEPNYGWKLVDNNISSIMTYFHSKEYGALVPYLEIKYADIYVDDDADPSWYDAAHVKTIQEGIDNATSGDTVFVFNGTYNENVNVNKQVILIGETNENTVIDGSGSNCVRISASLSTISGFTIKNGYCGIEIRSNNNRILDNIIEDNYIGINFFRSCFNKIIGNKVIDNENRGITIYDNCNQNILFDNIVNWNGYWSLSISFYCENNTIIGNTFTTMDNNIQISYYSNNNKIHHNNLMNNLYGGNDECQNFWDNGYPSGGNFWYWSDYFGDDANNDGIKDNPLYISGGNNYDYYPLMHLFGGIREMPTGWSFVSLPANHTADKHSIMFSYNNCLFEFQDAVDDGIISPYLFGWNRTLQSYQFVDFLEAGFGCWMYIHEPCELWYQYENGFGGGYVDSFITELKTNWNIVGVPFYENVEKTDLIVNDVEWNTAVSNGWISDFVFGWDEVGQTYVFSDSFQLGKAYWLYAYQPSVVKRNS